VGLDWALTVRWPPCYMRGYGQEVIVSSSQLLAAGSHRRESVKRVRSVGEWQDTKQTGQECARPASTLKISDTIHTWLLRETGFALLLFCDAADDASRARFMARRTWQVAAGRDDLH
jgi:hypothetical protein